MGKKAERALLSKTKIELAEGSKGSLLFESLNFRDHEIILSP